MRPTWSSAAAMRALRATLVIPGLFALTSQVVGNVQMATFAAFGGFATLVLAEFGGTRRDKLVAHGVLAVAGSALVVIGTVVSSVPALAAVVTVPVAFCVLFAGIAGPNAASGATAILLAYVLPAASPGTFGMIPSRLAGWWLASAAGTLAVLTLSPRPDDDRLRAAAAASATALEDQLDAALSGAPSPERAEAAMAAKQELLSALTDAPHRPTGLAVRDQALANLVEDLEWCTALVNDAVKDVTDLADVAETDRRLFHQTAGVLRDTARVLRGADVPSLLEDLDELRKMADAARVAAARDEGSHRDEAVHVAFHAYVVAAAVHRAAANSLIAARRVDPALVAERARWRDGEEASVTPAKRDVWVDAARQASGNASLRSVWFLNSSRGAVALAAAVAVADVTNVQHGFWVVLGTLSVLRTNAASTGATALRALGGTVAGFFIGAGLILAIGSHTNALWAALPLAVLVASYAPGTAPFAVGQAAFTVTVAVLYNILVPVGWKVGVLRVEDVAIGAAVSAVVGALFWPRGASAVVRNDLADSFHTGGIYLVQATAWALGLRSAPPDAGASAVGASVRLDDALRALLAEQGTKRVPKEQLQRLIGGSLRLRLAAQSLAELPRPDASPDSAGPALVQEAVRLGGVLDDLAARLGRTPLTVAREIEVVGTGDGPVPDVHRSRSLWVREHLDHVGRDVANLVELAASIGDPAALPWWR